MRSSLAVLLLLLLLVAFAARGEDASADEPPIDEVEEIAVTGQAWQRSQTFRDTPIETEIVSDAEIRELPATNAADAVRNLPGIRVQRRVQGEEAAVSIEGMPPGYTRVLVDGQRYSGEIGGVDDLRDVPVANVERIEVLRGAQGLRQGPDAGGGVIDIVTKSPPRDAWRADLRAGGGDDHNIQASGTLGLGRGPVAGSITFDHDQIDGYDPPDDVGNAVFIPTGEDSRRLSRDVYSTFDVFAAESVALRTRVGWRREEETFVFADTDDTGQERTRTRWLASQAVEWFARPSTRVSGAITWFQTDTDSQVGRTFAMEEEELRLQAAAEQLFDTGPFSHAITLGLDGRIPRLRLREGPLPATIENDDLAPANVDEQLKNLGIFLVDETDLFDQATLEVGVRLQLQDRFDAQLLPQAALLVRPWQTDDGRALRLRVSYGRNFRPPSLRELYQPPTAQLGGAYFLAGNPELQPETSISYRAGIELVPASWLTLSVVGFYNEIEDHVRSTFAGSIPIGTTVVQGGPGGSIRPGLGLICQVIDGYFPECAALAGGTGVIVVPRTAQLFRKANLDGVTTRGLEARLHAAPHRLVDFELGYTFLDTAVSDSNVNLDELPNEPPHVVDGRVVLRAPRIDTSLTVQVRWRDSALIETSGTGLLGFATTERSEPSLVLDARLVQPIGEHVELYADLYNATDQRVVDSYVVRGRTFFVGLRARFDGDFE